MIIEKWTRTLLSLRTANTVKEIKYGYLIYHYYQNIHTYNSGLSTVEVEFGYNEPSIIYQLKEISDFKSCQILIKVGYYMLINAVTIINIILTNNYNII